MKTLKQFTVLLGMSLSIAYAKTTVTKSDANALPSHYSKINFPNWEYNPPAPQDFRIALDGGAIAYLVPDSTLGLISMTLYFGVPNLPLKPSEVAAVTLYASLLKTGGTKRFSPEKLEDTLEFVAASLSAHVGDYQSEMGINCMQKDFYPLLQLLPGIVLQPRLDPEVFKLQQKKIGEAIRHRYDTPRGVMGTASEFVMYGSHPSNWMPQEKEILKLTPSELKFLLGKGFTSQNLVIAVSGQFNREEMLKNLNALVAKFPKPKVSVIDSVIKTPSFKGPQTAGVYVVDKTFSQATIKLSAMGVQRPHPDYYRLIVASSIFGDGGFTSRLVTRVRSNEGLAYGIGSEVVSDYERSGTVYVSLQTKVETAAYALKLIKEEMLKMAKEGITDEELQRAKDGLIKSLPSTFDTPSATASIFAQGEIWKRDLNHFTEYVKTIQAMTKSEVEQTFAKYFNPDSMRIVIVGPKAALLAKDEKHNAQLSDFGVVHFLTTEEIEKREALALPNATKATGKK